MTAVFAVAAIAVVGGLAVLIARDRPLIAEDPAGETPLRWSPTGQVAPGDLAEVRFAVALRGYRMDQVDQVLDDTRAALRDRDEQILELQRVVSALGRTAPTEDAAVGTGRVQVGGAPSSDEDPPRPVPGAAS